MKLRSNYPVARPLPIPESRIARGPYYEDAQRLIKKEFLLDSSPPPQKATARLKLLEHFKRMAVQRKMLPPPELRINSNGWTNETLDQIREFIAFTPLSQRCMCSTRKMTAIDDHWLECPIGCELKRARAVKEKEEAMRQRVANFVAHSEKEVLQELSEVQFLLMEEMMKLERVRRTSLV